MEREPFDPTEFERLPDAVSWIAAVVAFPSIGSTNDEARRLAGHGASEGVVVVADEQTSGRGRLDRTWTAEPGTSLLASWIVRPTIVRDVWPVYSLATAVAASSAIEALTGVRAGLKWPNDLMRGDAKLGGILLEAAGDAVVIGLGLNVRQSSFPDGIRATSLLIERSPPIGRAHLLGGILQAFSIYAANPTVCLDDYRARCDTIGRAVRVDRAGASALTGRATGVGDHGELFVGDQAVTAGDVVHVR